MQHRPAFVGMRTRSGIHTLKRHEELPLLRDHLLRLDHASRRDRFHGLMDERFIERYAEKCANDGTIVIAYFADGLVRGAAELHPPEQSPDLVAEIAFSVETPIRRRGIGSFLFRRLIAEARAKGYTSLRITTGAGNEAMRALANKFGARLSFCYGESTGTIDVAEQHQPKLMPSAVIATIEAARAIASFNRAYWQMLLQMCGWGWIVRSQR